MQNDNNDFRDQRALTLIIDLVLLLEQSEQAKGTWLGSAYARASIISSTLLIECVSNSCLFSLALPSKLIDELDKLPPLAKLDYYLFSVAAKHINRGCRETELVAEILKLRDHMVHPKPKSGTLSERDGEQYVDYGSTKSLCIPLDNREWNHEIGKQIASAVIYFLKRFFLDWCALDKGRITTLIVIRERKLMQSNMPAWVGIYNPEYNLLKKWVPDVIDILDLRACTKDA